MKVFSYSGARRRLSEILDIARDEKVIIKRRRGESFSVVYKSPTESPFDIPGIKTKATTQDILDAIRESRSMGAEHSDSSN